jgi:hypothetical protein
LRRGAKAAATAAHLIVFSEPIINHGFYNHSAPAEERGKQWKAASRRYFFGYRGFVSERTWVGVHAPLFGLSRSLAAAVGYEASQSRGHVSSDAVMPLAAMFYNMKTIALTTGVPPRAERPSVSSSSSSSSSSFAADGSFPSVLDATQLYLYKPHRKPFAEASAPLYLAWRLGTTPIRAARNMTWLLVPKEAAAQFEGWNCLKNMLLHPVYL